LCWMLDLSRSQWWPPRVLRYNTKYSCKSQQMLATCFLLVYFLTLMMEATCSSKTSVAFHQVAHQKIVPLS
jgi:hypothetical protein